MFPRRWFSAIAAAVTAACVALPAAAAAPGACTAHSAGDTTPLLELYTSEGCDSCPPADRWLSAVVASRGAEVAAVAFHVDYWDRLGWKDRFASPVWTRRQYDLARAARSDLVYTPQVLLQGREFTGWRSERRSADALAAASRAEPRAQIAVEARMGRNAVAVDVAARVARPTDRRSAAVFVALTASGLVSEVRSGENAGRRLVHDHVARALERAGSVDARGEGAGTVVLPFPAEAGASASVVAFVQDVATGEVLQAVTVPLAGCTAAR
jgi:hypothetical protein